MALLTRLVARIARQGGGKLLDHAVDRVFPGALKPLPRTKASAPLPRSLTGKVAGAALARVALGSVPGAIVIGGGWLAKTLYDRRHAKNAASNPAEPAKDPKPNA
ncbi:MAG: hypothetical protein WCY11_02095 [Novosphingobium sp.]